MPVTLVRLRRAGTLVVFVLLCAAFSVLAPGAFASGANVLNLVQQLTTLAIAAAGATMVMVIGEFDLSLGFVASLAGVTSLALLGAGQPVAAAVLAGVATGALAGLVNGVLVALFGTPSFIATLAVGTVVSGLAYGVSGGASLFSGVPAAFTALGRAAPFGVPVLALWMAGTLLLCAGLLGLTTLGRHLKAIGDNAEAARLSGVAVPADRVAAFTLAGLLSALAGVLLAARLGSAQHTMGESLLLPAYAAVFLGMTVSRVGAPTVSGTVLGVLIAGVIANGLTILGAQPFVQRIATGAIILVAVLAQRLGRARM